MDEDLLVNTRKRRANAGSRLKQLLSAEEVGDEDVDLLFVEDEDDGEYHSDDGEEEEGEEEEEGSGDDDEAQTRTSKKRTREASTEAQTDEEGSGSDSDSDSGSDAQPVNNDEMFSDSSDESSSDDSDVGEKELQKAEKARQRELKKKKKFAPQIKKASTTPHKPKKIYEAPKADTLLSEHRRSSSRRAAVQSKLDLVEKLKEEEQRRSTLKPVQKIEYVEMTQEERLAEALETEKYNISTLNKYQEQENDRAIRRRELMLSKRRKLTDVMTIRSIIRYVPIEEERELEKFYLTRDVMKKKDRRGRKSDKQRKEEEEEKLKEERLRQRWEMLNNPEKSFFETRAEAENKTGDETTTAPNTLEETPIPNGEVKEQTPVKTETDEDDDTKLISQETYEKDKKTPLATVQEGQDSVIDVSSDSDDDTDMSKKKTNTEEDREDTPVVEEEFKDASDSIQRETTPKIEEEGEEETKEVPIEEVSKEDTQTTEPDDDVSMADADAEKSDVVEVPGETPEVSEKTTEDVDTDVKMEDTNSEMPTDKPTPEVKTVKFADELEQSEDKPTPVIKRHNTKHAPPSAPKVTYEGPLQKVGSNFISFENHYTVNRLRGLLLGKQSTLPAHRRSLEVEPIVRIRQDPSITSTDQSRSLKLPDLSILDSFPEFGNFEKIHRETTTVEAVKDTQITLKTEAPTGIYLPSGQRKMCLITGKPAMYFDPKTGMPYADVESYKVIKEIQDGVYKWCEGGYVSNYHAKGVPAGFDTF